MVFIEEIVKKLSATAVAYGLEYKEIDWLAPLYLPQDHPIIVTLMKLYPQFSGDADLEPIFLGGATNTRVFYIWTTFGFLFPSELLTEYEPYARVVMKYMFNPMKIYAYTIYQLTR